MCAVATPSLCGGLARACVPGGSAPFDGGPRWSERLGRRRRVRRPFAMKVYCIKGSEGAPGYLKQSMKLPKSWSSKPLLEVLKLFCETYNKKFPDA